MSNSIEHKIPEYINNIIGTESGDPEHGTWFKISDVSGTGETENYPSITPDGQRLSYDHPDYWINKKTVIVQTIRIKIIGNAVSAESWIRDNFELYGINDKLLAISSDCIDIYPAEDLIKIIN